MKYKTYEEWLEKKAYPEMKRVSSNYKVYKRGDAYEIMYDNPKFEMDLTN